MLKNNGVLNFLSAASELWARAERRAAPRRRARPRARAPISACPKLTQSAPESRGPPAVCKVRLPLHAPAEVRASLSPARQTPPPTDRRPPPRPVGVNPARNPVPARSSWLAASMAPGRERAHALSPHTQPPAREVPGEPTGSRSHKSALRPRPLAARFAKSRKARVGTAATSERPEPGRRHLASPGEPGAAPGRAPALARLVPPPPSPSSGCGLPAKVSACPRSLPHGVSGLPRGQGRKGRGVRHLARSSRPLTSISKSGRRNAVRKSEQKCAMAGTSHQERSSPSPAAPPSSGHISQARRWLRPRTPSAPRRPHAARAPLARPPRTPAAAQRLSSSGGGGGGGGCYSRCCRRSASA